MMAAMSAENSDSRALQFSIFETTVRVQSKHVRDASASPLCCGGL